jgi:hypothetical protein
MKRDDIIGIAACVGLCDVDLVPQQLRQIVRMAPPQAGNMLKTKSENYPNCDMTGKRSSYPEVSG